MVMTRAREQDLRSRKRLCPAEVNIRIPYQSLEWWGESPVCGGPSAVDQHEGAGDVGAGFRGEVEDHPDHLVRHGPAAEDALGRVGIVPVRGVFYLCRERCLDDAWGDGVDPDTAGPDLGSKGPEHLHRSSLGRGIDSLS